MPPAEFDELRLACLDAVDNDRKQWLDQRLRYANEPTLKTRLRAMFERMGSSSLPFIEYPNRWVNVVAGVRNALTHLDSRQAGFDGGDLYYLSESLFALTRACMLAELGITGEKIAAKSASHPFSWYAARLNAAVEQLRRVI